jgi:diguanylate cyclase (GGDEF)-like protein
VAARRLGITTYVSVPLLGASQEVLGTLCAASRESVVVEPQDLATMDVFARLISDQLSREASHAAARARAVALEDLTTQLRDAATRDPLTGLLNRSGIDAWFEAVLPVLDPAHEQLGVAYVDVDRFKEINDVHGHSAGDRVLQALAASLTGVGRSGDLHGRLGGDEFLVAAVLPAGAATFGGWAVRLRRAARLEGPVPATASVGVATVDAAATPWPDVLAAADRDMYAVKRRRQDAATQSLV